MILTPKDYEHIKKGLAFWLKRWEHNPLAYVLECVGDTPTHQQAKILKALPIHKFVAIKSGHGIGKTKLISWLESWWGDTRIRKRCVITGAGGEAIKDTIWPEVAATNEKKWAFLGGRWQITTKKKYNIEVDDGWFAVLRTASKDNPQALAGFHDCFFIIDEASAVVEEVFEVAKGAMGDPHNYGIMTGNPTKTSGYFFRTFQKDGSWHTMTFSSLDSMYEKEYSYDYVDPLGDIKTITVKGRQTEKWVKDMIADYGENSNIFKYRVLGLFASGDDDLIIEEDWLKNVFLESKIRDKSRKRIMGVDVGYTGNDDSAIVIRQGDDIIYVDSWHGKDTVITTQKVKAAFETFRCDSIYVDPIGVGAGVYDNLYHDGFPVKACDVREAVPKEWNMNPKVTQCKLLRDWLWWQARLFFNQRPVRFHGSEHNEKWLMLRDEMCQPTYCYEKKAVVVESKEKMKDRGLQSPNLADALNMTLMEDWKTGRGMGQKNAKSKKKKQKQVENFKCV